MPERIRATTVCLTLLSLLVVGPLAASPGSVGNAFAPTEVGQAKDWAPFWLREFLAWLPGILDEAGPEAVSAASKATASGSTANPASPDPDFGVTPQLGADIDPDG